MHAGPPAPPPPPDPEQAAAPVDFRALLETATVEHHIQGPLPLPPPGRAYDDGGNLGFAPPPPPVPALAPASQQPVPAAVAPPTEAKTTDEAPFARSVADALIRLAPNAGLSLQPHQTPPPAFVDDESDTTGWVLLAGRNAGKTYAGVRELDRRMNSKPNSRGRIIAPTFQDAVASCIDGPSGILEATGNRVVWKPSHPGGAQLQWPNGSVCYVIGTPSPREVDRLRAVGNIDFDLFEEAAANTQLVEVERQARLSRRRKGACWIATTTPRPLPTIRAWQKDPHVAISSATAHTNVHADPLWLAELERMYRGTRLYAQEVEGKVLEDVEGALWKISDLDRSRIHDLAAFYEMLASTGHEVVRAATGVDPASGTGTTGIVTVLMTDDRHLFVVEDASEPNRSAEQWARVAVDQALKWGGPIIPENDQGGDMVRAVLKAADLLDQVTILPARARGVGSKAVRAEPVGLLWERDDFRAHLVGSFPLLEEQMTSWVPDLAGQDSPDRMDAMVWAATYLWTRASFSDVTSRWPDGVSSSDPTAAVATARNQTAASRRPGAMVRWHRGVGRPAKNQRGNA